MRRVAIGVVVVLGVALIVMRSRRAGEPVPVPSPEAPTAGTVPAPSPGVPPEQKKPRGVSLRRPPPGAPGAPGAAPAQARPSVEGDAGAEARAPKVRLSEVMAMRDKRENPGPRAKEELEVLGYGIETVEADIDACLKDW